MSNSKESSSSSESSSDELEASNSKGRELEFFGWVYHLGVNSIGQEYCHLRFLSLRGKYVAMYKRDPHENPAIKPIRKGVISHTLMVEELGRKKINFGEVYVLRFYNRLDETKKGEIACATAGEARKWMKAFDQAKQQAMYDISISTGVHKLSIDGELNLDGHRPRVRRYAKGLKRLIRIGKGPEMLVKSTSNLGSAVKSDSYLQSNGDDAIEAHDWRCVKFINGVRIFEDVANPKGSKEFLLKAVGVIDASFDTVFEVILSLDARRRHEWDVLTGELELLDSVDGHYDVVYGTYEPKNLSWWQSKKDFIYSRQWFLGQDGAYTILQFPAVHKKRPIRSGYQRIKINRTLEGSGFNTCVSPVTIDLNQFNGSLHRGKGESDTNCWTVPTGQEFMIRGKNYLKDNSKVVGGDPLLKLLAVDFLKADKNIENVALHPNSLVQSEAGKRLPLIIILNLQEFLIF